MAQVYAAECCCANSAAGLTLLMHIGNSSIESLVHILLAHSTHIYATKLCYTLEDNQNITYHDHSYRKHHIHIHGTQLDQFLSPQVDKVGGMMTMAEVYCLSN